MSEKIRILIGVVVVLVLIGAVLGIEALRGKVNYSPGTEITLEPGNIPIYLNGELVAAFKPEALESLELVSFVDAEEGKTQEGWMLRDVLLTTLDEDILSPQTQITVSSSVSDKSAELTWAEVKEEENMVMFDQSSRGTLKLVSRLEGLDTRNDWVQDVDRIEVVNR